MLKNYLKTGFRSLTKNKLPSLINIFGLSLAIGCCLVVFEFLDWSMHMDNFHAKIDRIFVIEKTSEANGNRQYFGDSPSPLGPMLKNDFPQVKNIARLHSVGTVLQQGENVFRESVSFVDNAFYQIFDFPVKWGSKQHFTDQDAIVLTQELSEKLFGKENSVGKNVSIRFFVNDREVTENFTVKGVFNKRPVETSFYFSALIPYQKMHLLGMDKTGDWSQSVDITFIESDNEAALLPIKSQIKKYLELYNTANQNNKMADFHFQPLNTMNFHAYQVSNSRFNATKPVGFIILLVIAISILVLVYFNYMNIALASASSRFKEIGVRKVMGSNRKQIIFQFVLENLIVCSIAVVAGLFLAASVFLPWFSQIANIELGQNLFTNYRTWVALLVLIVVSAISGAAYPSFYVSALQPVSIVKANSKIGNNNRFRKALLGFQFFLTFLSISLAAAFIQETKNAKQRPWGYEPANNVVVNVDNTSSFEVLKTELNKNNQVKSISGSVQSLGNYTRQLIIGSEGKEYTVQGIDALPGFASHLGIKVMKGRDLSEEFETDATASVLVNQAFLKHMNWASGIGKTIEHSNQKYTVVGEVNNFHFENFQSPIGPLLILGCKPGQVNFAYIRTSSNLFLDTHAVVEQVWKKINPDVPFQYYYQDTVFDGYFQGFTQVSQILGASSLMMMLISMFGIFGLALLILGKKMKEISVRKVLGANMRDIGLLINKEFLFATGFASLLGFPVSYWITSTLFNQISPESRVSFSPLILSFIILLVMTVLSVSWHLFKVYTASPTKYLRNE